MSYMFIVVIGAVAGWVAGQYVKGSEMGIGIDFAAGAVGAIVAVALSRLLGPAGASGLLMSAIIAIIGAVGSLFLMRRVMKARMVPATRPRRRP
ncbi:MAG: GlsB/YeaQ/YmgE family stress response membrane protein [Thermoanaerobaculia bacterium]